jgi:hypothetical protein
MKKNARILHILTLVLIAVAGVSAQAQKTRDVVFGKFEPYNHSSNLFLLQLPANWSVKDSSRNGEVILSIADPSENAGVSVHVWQQDKPLVGGPAQYLKNYLNDSLGTLTNFTQGEPRVQKDGSTGIYFKWDEAMKSETVKMWGDAFIEQRGNVVGMIVLLLPEEQYQQKKEAAYRLVNSFGLKP